MNAQRICEISDRRAAFTGERKQQPTLASLPVVETDFTELADGTLVEMIEDPGNPARSVLAVYKDGEVHHAEKLECGDRVLVPIPRQEEIIKHVRLARGAKPYGSVELLIGGVMAVLQGCLDLDFNRAFLLAVFVLSTWLIERLPVAPYLALVGLPRSGKTTVLRVLNLLCRRSLLTTDITSAAFYQVYDRLTPTLLVDETLTAGEKRKLFHLLRAGTTPDVVALRRDRSFKAYGAKAVSWTELPNDAALNSRCVIIPMQESTRTDLAKPTDTKILAAADILRKELLQHRFENYKTLSLPRIPGDERLHSRSRDLYQGFALATGGHPEICRLLVRAFEYQQDFNREPLSPSCVVVLRALYAYIHSHPENGKCSNKGLTKAVNLDLKGAREYLHLLSPA